MKSAKKYLVMVIIALMFFSPVADTIGTSQTAQAMSTKTLKKRAKKAKKTLPKKVLNFLKKGYYKPSCGIGSAKRKGKYLTCKVGGGIGEGAYELKVKVNLKTGKVKVIGEPEVDIPTTFKIAVK